MTVLSNFTDAELRKWATAYGVSTKSDSREELLSALVRSRVCQSLYLHPLAKSLAFLLRPIKFTGIDRACIQFG